MTIKAEEGVEVVGQYEFEMKIFSYEKNKYIGFGPHQLVSTFGGIYVEVLDPDTVIPDPDPSPEDDDDDDEEPVGKSFTFEEVYEQLLA